MEFKLHLFIVQCIVFCYQYNFIYARNGRTAEEGEFPFVVSIKKLDDSNPRPEKDHTCAGVLISNKDVLTIERCFFFLDEGAIELIIGSVNLRVGTKRYPLWWITYTRWAELRNEAVRFPHNELTVARLSEPVPSAIVPVTCASSQNPLLYGSEVVTAGWGELMIGMTPRVMRTAVLDALTNTECQQKVNRLFGHRAFTIRDNYLCTNGDHEDDWHMIDFGGPLLYNGELIAINQESHPFPTIPPHPEKINMHIRLDYYSDFIQDVKNNM